MPTIDTPAAATSSPTSSAASRSAVAPAGAGGHASIPPLVGLDGERRPLRREDDRPADHIGVPDDVVAGLELALQERPGERVLDEALDRPLEWPRPVRRIVALAGD